MVKNRDYVKMAQNSPEAAARAFAQRHKVVIRRIPAVWSGP